jgi:hypothetical protein
MNTIMVLHWESVVGVAVIFILFLFSFLRALYLNYKNKRCDECNSKEIEISKKWVDVFYHGFEITKKCKKCGHISSYKEK